MSFPTEPSVLLHGLTQGVRPSRRLERASGHAVDFMWLAELEDPSGECV